MATGPTLTREEIDSALEVMKRLRTYLSPQILKVQKESKENDERCEYVGMKLEADGKVKLSFLLSSLDGDRVCTETAILPGDPDPEDEE